MPIEAGQIYSHFDFQSRAWTRIRVTAYTPGSNRVDVVDAYTGKRPRSILASRFHDGPMTRYGRPRRTGYVLELPKAAG